jgi:hypothetical protein
VRRKGSWVVLRTRDAHISRNTNQSINQSVNQSINTDATRLTKYTIEEQRSSRNRCKAIDRDFEVNLLLRHDDRCGAIDVRAIDPRSVDLHIAKDAVECLALKKVAAIDTDARTAHCRCTLRKGLGDSGIGCQQRRQPVRQHTYTQRELLKYGDGLQWFDRAYDSDRTR